MIVIDVETTGTNPYKHSIVSIGAVDFNEPKEQLYLECRMWEGAHVEQAALDANGYSQEQITDSSKISEGEAITRLLKWLEIRSNITVAAQNPIFDLGFLQAAAERNHIDYPLGKRSVDLHAVTYAHMIQRGIEPPTKNHKSDVNSDSIMAYVGIPAEPKPHIAINGALWEAEALSRLLKNRNLLEQFAQFPIPWA